MVLGFKRKGPDGVGCYGKLPLHGDYVSHQSDGQEARRLTAWLDEGYRITGGRDAIDAAGTRFVFPGRGKQVLFGEFWPSADASGTRRFPFALFASVPARRLSSLGSKLPLAIGPVWREMESAFPDLKETPSADAVSTRIGAIRVPEFGEGPDFAGRFADCAKATDIAAGAKDVLFDLMRLTGAIAPGKRGNVPAFAIRLPLHLSCDPEVETAAWLEVLARRLDENALPGQCHVFVRPASGETGGEVFIFHRDLKPEDLGFVLAPTDEYPYANLLGAPGDDAAEYHGWLEGKLGSTPTLKEMVEVTLSDWKG